jgi:hypothetical protein
MFQGLNQRGGVWNQFYLNLEEGEEQFTLRRLHSPCSSLQSKIAVSERERLRETKSKRDSMYLPDKVEAEGHVNALLAGIFRDKESAEVDGCDSPHDRRQQLPLPQLLFSAAAPDLCVYKLHLKK